ncbi:hypothetical protein BJ742DRAFT_215597 [Cladochytrium replicatum]|nr:hypothetical protein BJ742DRAFT_215597 [Cladochytrium replicatum]
MFLHESITVLRGQRYLIRIQGEMAEIASISPKRSQKVVPGAPTPGLDITLQDEETRAIWWGRLTAEYIEEITKKTGNFKRFPTFVDMLATSIKQEDENLHLELLTLRDIEALKRGNTGSIVAEEEEGIPQKVYLIMTYTTSFDRIHYPLPLGLVSDVTFNSNHSVVELKAQVQTLQTENEQYIEKISALLRENDRLKHELKAFLDERSSGTTLDIDRLPPGVVKCLEQMHVVVSAIKKRMIPGKLESHFDSLRTLIDNMEWLMNQCETGEVSMSPPRDKIEPSRVGRTLKRAEEPRDRLRSKENRSPHSSIPRPTATRSKIGSMSDTNPFPNYTKRHPSATRGRTPSPSKARFKRFDPTGYVEEHNRKLDERRSRSRERSAVLPTRTTMFSRDSNVRSTSRASNGRSASRTSYRSRSVSSSEVDYSRSRNNSPMHSRFILDTQRRDRREWNVRPTKPKPFRPATKKRVKPGGTIDDIDRRLEALRKFLKDTQNEIR